VVRVSVQNEFEGKWDDIDASVSLGKQRSSCLEGVSSPRRERGRLTVSQAHLVTQQARLAFSDRELRRIFFGDGLRFRGNRTRISLEEFTTSYNAGVLERAEACAEINLVLRQSLTFIGSPATSTNDERQPSSGLGLADVLGLFGKAYRIGAAEVTLFARIGGMKGGRLDPTNVIRNFFSPAWQAVI